MIRASLRERGCPGSNNIKFILPIDFLLKRRGQSQSGFAMNLNGIVVRLHSEFSFPIVQFPLDASKKPVGKALGLNTEKALPGRKNNSISAGKRLAETSQRVSQNPLRFCFQNKGTLSVIKSRINLRLAFPRSHDISKEIKVIL
jgi:hypothetical protein